MKKVKAFGLFAAAGVLAGVSLSFGDDARQAVFNAKQLGIEDLDLDFDDDPAPAAEDAPVIAEQAMAEIADEAEEAVADEAEEALADEAEDAVAEIADEAEEALADETEEADAEGAEEPVAEDADETEEPAEDEAVEEEAEEEPVPAAAAFDIDDLDLDVSVADADADEPAQLIEEPAEIDEEEVEAPATAVIAEVIEEEPDADYAAAPAPAAASTDAAFNQRLSELTTMARVRLELEQRHGLDCIAQGKTALATANWDRAAEKFKDALEYISERAETIGYRKEARNGLAEAYYRKSLELKGLNNLLEAEKAAHEANRNGHPKAEALVAQLQDLQENPPKKPAPTHVAIWKQPEYQINQAEIKDRMKAAKEYYAVGELRKSRMEAEFILRDNPWHADAVNMLRRISIAEHNYADNERMTDRAKMIGKVTETWVPRTYFVDFATQDGPIGPVTDNDPANRTLESKILDKMRKIIIPEIDFREANITDVVTFLSEASREHDEASTPAEERGVNIVLDLGQTANAAPAGGGADIWGNSAAVAPASSGGIASLTINTRFTSLLSALDMIMEMAGLKYRVRDNVVMIMPKNRPEGDLVHRMYNVLPTIVDRVPSITPLGSGAANDGWGVAAGSVEATTDWKGFFSRLGVNWPDGSTVQYMNSIGKLVVRNTASDLATLESVLEVLNVTPKQIQIEVRFVEVMQTDLSSFGFEWMLNDDWEMMEMKDDAHLPPASRRRLTMGRSSFTQGFSYLSGSTDTSIRSGLGVADGIAKISSILTNPELSLALHILNSRQGADLLSAPKVVAQAGTKATIKVVTEYIYPTEYNVEMLESSNSTLNSTTYTGAVVEPQSFETREVGVILEVTPEVTPDGSMINLTLTPSVVSEPTWKNYGSTYPVDSGEYVQLPMEQPFFPVRSIATSVQIYNGATVVMGGMITEERITNEDKIPFLGDIPLIGFLFRNKYEQSIKRNLLLFVTAELVDPSGRKVRDGMNPMAAEMFQAAEAR